jgi:SAM-dependent methyltransferase
MSLMIPMPPVEFQAFVCGPSAIDRFEAAGCWQRDMLHQQGMLTSGVSLLDVGCGCGRLARYLTELPIGSYAGFDRHKGMVDWCVQEIGSRDPRFRFDYVDLKSVYTVWDDQAGAIDAETFRFPYADATFDSVVLASVCTHMPPGETRQYLGELARVMRPGAKAMFSIFLSPTGATEVRDGINVFHGLPGLLADIGALPLRARLVVPGMSDSEQADPVYDTHNWYELTRARGS